MKSTLPSVLLCFLIGTASARPLEFELGLTGGFLDFEKPIAPADPGFLPSYFGGLLYNFHTSGPTGVSLGAFWKSLQDVIWIDFTRQDQRNEGRMGFRQTHISFPLYLTHDFYRLPLSVHVGFDNCFMIKTVELNKGSWTMLSTGEKVRFDSERDISWQNRFYNPYLNAGLSFPLRRISDRLSLKTGVAYSLLPGQKGDTVSRSLPGGTQTVEFSNKWRMNAVTLSLSYGSGNRTFFRD